MFRIKTMNKIAQVGLNQFPADYQVGDSVEGEKGILVRSAPMHDYEFPDALRAIARAGAGTNNIPIDRCSESGIVVFNTPGANSNAVKELVVAAMLWFVETGQMPGWALLIVILREFAVSGLRMVASDQGRVIAAGWSGKVKTASTMVCIVLMFLSIPDLVNTLCVAVIVVTTLWSGVEYFVKNRDCLRDM